MNSAPNSSDSSPSRPETSPPDGRRQRSGLNRPPDQGPDDEVGDHDGAKAQSATPCASSRPTLHYRTIHGYRRAFRIAGSGPAILLIHGIGDNSTTWSTVQSKLAQRFTVIAPDLLGHGKSDKPRADYSVAAYANGMRDLLSVLDIERVTVVGHSLGGGVAMQFAYQFPQLVDRLILVGAGGVTKDVNVALRIASLPLGSEALALLRLPMVLPALQVVGRIGGALFGSTGVGRDIPDVLRILADLPEPTASSAFARTLRAVVDWRGQVVTMLDRCYLTESVPVQLIWGSQDSVIPVSHARMAHAAMPGAQLEVFEGSGHFPFHDDPDRFVEIVEKFIDSTDPAVYDQDAAAQPAAHRRQRERPHRIDRHPGRGARRDGRRRAQRHLTVPPQRPSRRSIGCMAIDVTVLRVFTDSDGDFGNPLGVVDASLVAPADRQRVATELGYSETIFIDLPAAGTPTPPRRTSSPRRSSCRSPGIPTVGASWWLKDRGTPVNTLQVPAGVVQVGLRVAPRRRVHGDQRPRRLGARLRDLRPGLGRRRARRRSRRLRRRRRALRLGVDRRGARAPSGRGCSPAISASPRTRRPAPARCASPTT